MQILLIKKELPLAMETVMCEELSRPVDATLLAVEQLVQEREKQKRLLSRLDELKEATKWINKKQLLNYFLFIINIFFINKSIKVTN